MLNTDVPTTFENLELPTNLLSTLTALGYQHPTPVQAASIPHLLTGKDLLGHAPTGTGKTAAFSLPLLARIDVTKNTTQVLVLAPTRELAIQVTAAMKQYGADLKGLKTLSIYGGQDYGPQLQQLRAGQHVVVGTPGRVMDHIRRGTLKLDTLEALVLDEADEMLKMGFLEDVEWILEQTPDTRQMALFSATMPREIKRIATRFMKTPETVSIKALIGAKAMINQRYSIMAAKEKPEALQKLLNFEAFDAVLIFVRTKVQTESLAELVSKNGHRVAAIHGDLAQSQREQIIKRLSKGQLDIVVATDVAARGLDVERISHVINFDAPHDAETYVHRIGRTGRAGRSGEAIIFLNKREERLIRGLERETQNKLTQYHLPTAVMIREKQLTDFAATLKTAVEAGAREELIDVIDRIANELETDHLTIAAVMASQLLPERSPGSRKTSAADAPRAQSKERSRPQSTTADAPPPPPKSQPGFAPSKGKAIFRIEVGHDQSVEPGEIVGAIANEGGLNGKEIGQIQIFADHTLLELPNALPRTVFVTLKNVWIRGRRLSIHRLDAEQANAQKERSKKSPRAVKTASRGKPKPAWQKDNARPAPRRDNAAGKPAESRAPKKTIKRRTPKPAAS